MENKSKNKIVIVVSCLLLVIAGTFAYFVAKIGSGAQGDVKINANSMDDLKFEVNKDINLSIDQQNFASGAGNLSDEATAKAMTRPTLYDVKVWIELAGKIGPSAATGNWHAVEHDWEWDVPSK